MPNLDSCMRGTQTGRISCKEPNNCNTPKSGEASLLSVSEYRAEAYLRRCSAHEVIGNVYDEDEMLRSALLTTIPEFEYPDWSHKTIGDVLKKYFPKAAP